MSTKSNTITTTKKRPYKNVSSEIRRLVIDECVVNGNTSMAEVARKFHLPWSTARNIVDAYFKDYQYEAKKRGGKRKEVVKFGQEQENFIIRSLDDDCTKTLNRIKVELESNFPELATRKISMSGIWKFIVKKIGFTLNRVKPIKEKRNDKDHLEARHEFVTSTIPQRGILYKKNCIFIDAADFNINLICSQGQSKKKVITTKSKRKLNLSILVAISYYSVQSITVKDETTHDILETFVAQIIKKLDDTFTIPHFFIMDNDLIQKAPPVLDLFKNSRHQVCCIPDYSPFLNPVEECFSELKTHINRKTGLNTEELRCHIKECTCEFSKENCNIWVERSLQYFEACSEKKPIYE